MPRADGAGPLGTSADAPARERTYPIGVVAAKLMLSLRTLRYWDEVGLVTPSGRSGGGSRLYTGADIERLAFVRAMKPIDFTIEELKDVLSTYDALRLGSDDPAVRANGARYAARIRDRCLTLESRIVDATAAAKELDWFLAAPAAR